MRNITITVDDETYERALIAAAALNTSVPALVEAYVRQLAMPPAEVERLKHQEREIRKRITDFTASSRLPREVVHF